MERFGPILEAFDLDGKTLSVEPYGEGHINTTYLVTTTARRYILQKINTRLFTDVNALMRNIRLVTAFLRDRVSARGGDPDRECLTVVPTRTGEAFHTSADGASWRVYRFIERSACFQIVTDPAIFFESAKAFGAFAGALGTFDASSLTEILPHFHDTAVRFEAFSRAVEADKAGRAKSVAAEIAFYRDRKAYCTRLTSKLADGTLPLKVTHNDTKLNNVLFDAESGKALAVIDLDTVMPGCVCYDFGDSIRFGCSTAAEDEPDLDKVHFDLALFKTYARGYLSASRGGLTQAEKDDLAFGSILMTYECGMRFLADYLDGDVYFRTARPSHNLDRTRTQMRLVSEMEAQLDAMNAAIAEADV